jgi:hypothetical protein
MINTDNLRRMAQRLTDEFGIPVVYHDHETGESFDTGPTRTAAVQTHDATLPDGDIIVEDFWLEGIYAGGRSAIGSPAKTYTDAVKEAAELLDEDPEVVQVRVSAVCWPSTREVLVATVTR